MQRRHFSSSLAVTAIALTSVAKAQRVPPVEGTDYVKLNQAQPVSPGKLEVIEFFWYGCPHCYAFEPALEAWVGRLPADTAFTRIPIAFREEPFVPHQKIYYALLAMGRVEQMHQKVFAAIHVDHNRLDKPADIAAFMAANGVDSKKFLDAYNAPSMPEMLKMAFTVAEAYQVDGVPSLGVQGRYLTSATLTGSNERSLVVADFLLDRSRKGT